MRAFLFCCNSMVWNLAQSANWDILAGAVADSVLSYYCDSTQVRLHGIGNVCCRKYLFLLFTYIQTSLYNKIRFVKANSLNSYLIGE